MAWQDLLQTWLHGPPLQPVNGDPINPAYNQMPNATAPITDIRGAGPSTWMSRPHDQNVQSRNMAGYYLPFTGNDLDAVGWQKTHGWLSRDPPKTPLPDPNFIPTDPEIMARIKAKEWAEDTWPDDSGWGG